MPYLMIMQDGRSTVAEEAPFTMEADLHGLVRDHPELLPTKDLIGEECVLYVVGYEVPTPNGKSADLVLVDEAGRLGIAEFKLEKNDDMRQVIAQTIEYGSQLWGLSFEDFESRVVRRYFDGRHCDNDALRGKGFVTGMREMLGARAETWDEDLFRNNVAQALEDGDFWLFVVADHLDRRTSRAIDYMRTRGFRNLYAVEVRQFPSEGTQVLVPTAITRPTVPERSRSSGRQYSFSFVSPDEATTSHDPVPAKRLADSLKRLPGRFQRTGASTLIFHWVPKDWPQQLLYCFRSGENAARIEWQRPLRPLVEDGLLSESAVEKFCSVAAEVAGKPADMTALKPPTVYPDKLVADGAVDKLYEAIAQLLGQTG